MIGGFCAWDMVIYTLGLQRYVGFQVYRGMIIDGYHVHLFIVGVISTVLVLF